MEKENYADLLEKIDKSRLPRHIGIIMDGNGRWAAARNMPRSAGHKAGADTMRSAVELCREIGVEVLTVYAFSTENWQRPQMEVDFLMELLVKYLHEEIKLMNEQDIRLGFLGEMSRLSPKVQQAFAHALDSTSGNKTMLLNLAINYGGRDELVRAVRKICRRVQQGELEPEAIDQQLLADNLDTAGQPDPDLLIRPSGELRTSNFLVYQAAYSELWFNDKLWPDFGKRDLLTAILDYQGRERRFGKVPVDKKKRG